jgi:hypothetical protein
LRLREAALLRLKYEKLQPSQAASILAEPAIAEEKKWIDKGANRFHKPSRARQESRPGSPTERRRHLRTSPKKDKNNSNFASKQRITQRAIAKHPAPAHTHRIHEMSAGRIQLRRHESSKEQRARPAQRQSYEGKAQVHREPISN